MGGASYPADEENELIPMCIGVCLYNQRYGMLQQQTCLLFCNVSYNFLRQFSQKQSSFVQLCRQKLQLGDNTGTQTDTATDYIKFYTDLCRPIKSVKKDANYKQ